MVSKVVFLLCVASVALALPQNYGYSEEDSAQYSFDWAVRDEYSNNNYGHREQRDGDETKGFYYVYLPDGRLQRVQYYVSGDSGFVARVTYEGEATFPDVDDDSYEAPRRPSQRVTYEGEATFPDVDDDSYEAPRRPSQRYQEPERPSQRYSF